MTKPVLPSDEFRWQQNVEDSIGRLQRAPARMTAFLTASSAYSFRDLAGDANFAYEVIVSGRLTQIGGTENQITVRPTGRNAANTADVTDLTSRNQQIESYNDVGDTNVGPVIAEYGNGNGLFLGSNRWTTTCDVMGKMSFQCHSSRRIQSVIQFACKPSVSDARTLGGSGHGMMYIERRVTNVEINFGGGTFTGAVSLEPLF